jgi:hypothetical protein
MSTERLSASMKIGCGLAAIFLWFGATVRAEITDSVFHGHITTVEDRSFPLDASVTNGTPFEGFSLPAEFPQTKFSTGRRLRTSRSAPLPRGPWHRLHLADAYGFLAAAINVAVTSALKSSIWTRPIQFGPPSLTLASIHSSNRWAASSQSAFAWAVRPAPC